MTVDEFKNRINSVLNTNNIGNIMFLSVKSMQSQMVERIFEQGKNSQGGKIGNYDTTNDLYVADQNSPKAGNHKGKPNKDGKSKTIKTTYYDNYKAFKAKQGRQSGYVDLRLFGRLQSDFANSPVVNGDVVSIAVSSENAKKIEGNEAKYGRVFSPTKEEKEILTKVAVFEFKKLILEGKA